MDIKQGPTSLSALFDGNTVVDVPSYQRNYVWKQEHLEIYLNDLFTAAEQQDVHFFGPIVLLDQSKKEGERRFSLIDGQQRVTTATMVICILRDLIFEEAFFKDSRHGDLDLQDALHGLLFGGKYRNEPKFQASWFIRDFFKTAIIAKPPRVLNVSSNGRGISTKAQIEQTREIRKAHRIIKAYIETKFEGLKESKAKDLYLKLIEALTDKFQIHSMVVSTEADAYQLFESINHLGYKLEPADLLKSLTFRKVEKESPDKLDIAVEQWKQILENLDGFPISKFLRHYLLATQDKKVQASKIFAGFQKLLTRNAFAASQTLNELLQASKHYSRLLGNVPAGKNPTTIDKVASRLNLISDTHRVLLLAAIALPFPEQEIEKVFRASEYLVFRQVAAKENAQDIETRYQKFANRLDKAENLEALDLVINDMIQMPVGDSDLEQAVVKGMGSVGLQFDPREDLARYALTVITDDIAGGWNASATLEHLAPQKPDKNDNYWIKQFEGNKELYETALHWWGNLTLLEGPLNSSIRNADWAKKKSGSRLKNLDGLKKSGFLVTKKLLDFPDWNIELVRARGDWMLRTLIQLRGQDWVKSGKNSHDQISIWPEN